VRQQQSRGTRSDNSDLRAQGFLSKAAKWAKDARV